MADDFCKFFNETVKRLSDGKRRRDKPNRMSDAEVMTILIAFHMDGHRCLKHFYLGYVCKHWGHLFPKTVSYNRFVGLEQEVTLPLLVFVKQVLLGKCTGVNFVDSTLTRVCRNQRILGHKVFRGIAMRGKCSMGWLLGFKMHLIINEKGEVLSFMITPADVGGREPLKVKDFVKEIYGKLVGDMGYISKEPFHELFVDGIQLITKVRNNMKNCLMSVSDKVLLRKRAVTKSVNDKLKNIAQLEHSMHQSFNNFIVNAVSASAAYCFSQKKLAISLEYLQDNQLILL